MIIQNMFEEDINRPINGVIKVDQDELGVIEQEVKEYVITKELKKHFISFLIITVILSTDQHPTWVFGFQDSLEVVNLTSLKCCLIFWKTATLVV